MQDTATKLRTAIQEQAQIAFEQMLADKFPPHPDPESAITSLLVDLGEFYAYGEFNNAMEMKDPRWIDALAHACDLAKENLSAVRGEMQGPLPRGRLIPEGVG